MIRIYKQGTQTPIYEILDYITTNRQQVLDSDIQAKSSIKVEMITTLTSRYGNVRLFSTHDPRDYSSQNWAFASGTWGLQFEGSQMCIKPLGTSANDISSFEMLNYYFSNVQNKKYKYLLNCSGLLEIYDVNDVIQFTADCSAKTDLNKVSQTTIRFFGREMQERPEWMNGNTYDIKIYDGNDLVRHYVPVKRLSDDAIGFYETETETFLTSASSTSFTGTSKSTPDYIYETTGGELFVNRIMCNGTQLNSILCNNQSYWGNVEPTPPPAHDYSQDYFTTTALEDGTFTMNLKGRSGLYTPNITSVSYSTDKGNNWITTNYSTSGNTITINVTTGDEIIWKGIAANYGTSDSRTYSNLTSTCKFEISGNIMSLLYGDNFQDKYNFTGNYVFRSFLTRNSNLISAGNLILPATTLSGSCYQGLFTNCSSLTSVPKLPATTLANSCYSSMFYGCSSLTTAPELPVTTLQAQCYYYMFNNCSSLTTAPELPALTLSDQCYCYMFNNCTSLSYVKCLATNIGANACLLNWLNNVSPTGTFVKNANTSFPSGVSGIPSGWTVTNI